MTKRKSLRVTDWVGHPPSVDDGGLGRLSTPPSPQKSEAFDIELLKADAGFKTKEECEAAMGTLTQKMKCIACGHVFYEHDRDPLICPWCLKSHFTEAETDA